MVQDLLTDEVTTEETAAGPSLSNKLITIMEKGWNDPTPEEVRAPVTSRQWTNRKAKAEAARFLVSQPGTVTFSDIWGNVLRSEGGYVNDPNDPGGETKFGISKKSYPELDIPNLTAEQAMSLFKSDYFDKVGGDTLLNINPGLAAHVSDMAFNAGPKTAIKLMYDAVGLPRETQITPELIDKLSDQENLVKNYSVARLKYYANLENAPTYIKGWTNRINNLNKALNIKSGLNGAYKAAKALDVDSLVNYAFQVEEQLAPRFAELDAQEMDRLRRANEMLSPGYKRPKSDVQGKQLSSLGEVFKATYDAKYYTNTIDGMNELALKSAIEASNANRKALGDKFDESTLEKLTFGLYGGVNSLEDWEAEVKKFKTENPDVKLPFESVSQVYELTQKKAKAVEDAYNSLDSGSFKDGAGAALKKLAHVVFGYLPGEIMGALSDRTEAALTLAPLPGATTVKGIAKGAAVVTAGTGAVQTVVQPGRQEMGLEGGLEQGVINAATVGAGQAVLGSLVGIATKLWRGGSKETAREIFKETERLKKVINADIPSPQGQQLKRAVEDVDRLGKELERNPYGQHYQDKVRYEARRAQAMDDILNDRPVRHMDETVTNVIDNSSKLKQQILAMSDLPEAAGDLSKAVDAWTAFKKASVNQAPVENVSTLPILDDVGNIRIFASKEEAKSFMFNSEDAIGIKATPDGQGFYVTRAADLEPAEAASSRFAEDGVDAAVGGQMVRALPDSEDLAVAQRFPEYATVKELSTPEFDKPTYPNIKALEPHHQYLEELRQYGAAKLTNLDQRYEAAFKSMELLGPDHRLDISESLGDDASVSLKEAITEMQDERTALQEMFSCMTSPFTPQQ